MKFVSNVEKPEMKPATKSLLKTALVLFCCGLVLALVFWIVASVRDVNLYGSEISETDFRDFEETASVILARSDNAMAKSVSYTDYPVFSSIEINYYVGNLNIRTTDGESCILYENVDFNNLKCSIEGDTLTIGQKHEVCYSGLMIGENGFSFNGIRQLFLHSTSDSDSSITICINPEEIKIIDSINIGLSVGKVTLNSIKADNVNIKTSLGNIAVNNCEIANRIHISGTKLNTDFEDNSFKKCNIETIIGDVETDVNCGICVIKTNLGDINATVSAPLEEYGVSLSTDHGSIITNGEEYKESSLKSIRSTENSLTAKITLGDATLNYDPQSTIDTSYDKAVKEETEEPVKTEEKNAEIQTSENAE